jgi:hypothetical protein
MATIGSAVDVPSGSSRPVSAQHHRLPSSVQGPVKSKGPLGAPLVSSGWDGSEVEEAGGQNIGPKPTVTPDTRRTGPLGEFASRIEAKIQQRKLQDQQTQHKGDSSSASPVQRFSHQRAGQPSRSSTREVLGGVQNMRAGKGRAAATSQSRPSSTGLSDISPYTRGSTPLTVMSMELLPPPPLWDEGATAIHHGVPAKRHAAHAKRTTSITAHDWIDEKQHVLAEHATPISPVVSSKHTAIPRTLADAAIRWRGVRAASALARAFEVARTREEILSDGRVRLAQKLM